MFHWINFHFGLCNKYSFLSSYNFIIFSGEFGVETIIQMHFQRLSHRKTIQTRLGIKMVRRTNVKQWHKKNLGVWVCENWPISQGSQGLPQAAPSVEQHSDFSVAPLMFTSQRLSCIVNQHVLFMLSVEPRKQRRTLDYRSLVRLPCYHSWHAASVYASRLGKVLGVGPSS